MGKKKKSTGPRCGICGEKAVEQFGEIGPHICSNVVCFHTMLRQMEDAVLDDQTATKKNKKREGEQV